MANFYSIILFKLGPYVKLNIISFILLGFCAGLPLPLIGATMSAHLMEAGINYTSIGLFALAGTPYALKFIWSPLVDTLKIPFLYRYLGKRKSWVFLMLIILFMIFLLISQIDPTSSLFLLAVLVFFAAFFSATQDIALDAYRIELHQERDLAAGIATYVFGYRIALIVSGAGALYLAEFFSWKIAFITMSFCFLLGPIILLILPNIEEQNKEKNINKPFMDIFLNWFKSAVIEPFTEFIKRAYWVWILSFIALYKLGDALAGNMTTPFLLDIGFSKLDIANIVKVFGLLATLIGLFLGGLLVSNKGIKFALLIGGVFQMLSNLMFAALAYMTSNIYLLMATISIENISGGLGTAAFLAYLSKLTKAKYVATQFALLTSFMALARTQLSAPSGWMVEGITWNNFLPFLYLEHLDWVCFFTLTAILALPALLILNKATK